MSYVIIDAHTIDEAIEIAASRLNCAKNEVGYKILKKPSKGFLKFLSGSKYKIKAYKKNLKKHLNLKIENALKSIEELDAQFAIDFKEDVIYLTIYPPGKFGKDISIEKILERLKELGIEEFSIDSVKQAVKEKTGIPLKISEKIDTTLRDGYIKLEISSDYMQAILTIFPPKKGGKPITIEKIREILKKNNIIYGIDDKLIGEYCNNSKFYKPFLAAKGKDVIHGEDAKIEFYFNTNPTINFQEDEKGRVDFKEIGLIQNVSTGQILAKKIPPTTGEEGINIKGEKITPNKGKDIKIPIGKNVYLNENKDKAFSKIDGRVFLRNGKINVEPIFNIENVDYSTGNINFNGTVFIKGKIEDEFKVNATGDIFINKNVGKCYIESKKGQIIVGGGILGKGKGTIKAYGNITSRFVENAILISQNNIIVNKAIMHSRVYAGGEVVVNGERGLIVGGIVQAKKGITANEIGSISFTKTILTVGYDPETLKKIAEIEEEISNEEEKLEKFNLAIESLIKLMKNGIIKDKLEYEQKMNKLQSFFKREKEIIEKKQEEIIELKNKSSPETKSKIRVKGITYPGVIIEIANEHFKIRQEYRYTSFYFDTRNHEIKTEQY